MWNFLLPLLLVRSRPHLSTRAVTSGHRAWACSCQACAAVTTDAKIVHSPKRTTSTINPSHNSGPFCTVPGVIFCPAKPPFMVPVHFSAVQKLLDLTTPIDQLQLRVATPPFRQVPISQQLGN